jgi:hypothetical protein
MGRQRLSERITERRYFRRVFDCDRAPNKSLQATAMDLSVLTMNARLNIMIASEARLPWLCLSSGR